MRYRQLTSEQRHALAKFKQQGFSQAAIARVLGRHRSTISRELKRDSRKDGGYRSFTGQPVTVARRARSRRNWRFDAPAWHLVRSRLELYWSPEQIAGRLRRDKLLRTSPETIYRYVWYDKSNGGSLWLFLRGSRKEA